MITVLPKLLALIFLIIFLKLPISLAGTILSLATKFLTVQKMIKKFAVLIFVIMAFLSCSSPKALEYKTFHNFSIQSLGFDKSAISLNLEYYNPNNYGMQLRSTDLDIFINGNLFGHSSMDTLIRIPRHDTFSIPVKFDVNMQSIFKNAWNTLIGKEVLVKLSGKVKVGKANVFMSFPVNYESKETFSFF
jgi:LEA14-like dessication related protein